MKKKKKKKERMTGLQREKKERGEDPVFLFPFLLLSSQTNRYTPVVCKYSPIHFCLSLTIPFRSTFPPPSLLFVPHHLCVCVSLPFSLPIPPALPPSPNPPLPPTLPPSLFSPSLIRSLLPTSLFPSLIRSLPLTSAEDRQGRHGSSQQLSRSIMLRVRTRIQNSQKIDRQDCCQKYVWDCAREEAYKILSGRLPNEKREDLILLRKHAEQSCCSETDDDV
jgi:hypothetical protein